MKTRRTRAREVFSFLSRFFQSPRQKHFRGCPVAAGCITENCSRLPQSKACDYFRQHDPASDNTIHLSRIPKGFSRRSLRAMLPCPRYLLASGVSLEFRRAGVFDAMGIDRDHHGAARCEPTFLDQCEDLQLGGWITLSGYRAGSMSLAVSRCQGRGAAAKHPPHLKCPTCLEIPGDPGNFGQS